MTIGVGIFVTAVGAILTYAVNANLEGFDVHTAGIITMVVGLVITFAATLATIAQRRRTLVVGGVQPVVAAPNAVRLSQPTSAAVVERPVVVERVSAP